MKPLQERLSLEAAQESIRSQLKDPLNPFHYISYEQFFNNFHIDQNNFKNQNLNIIDIHLRYRWYVRERMAPYKWIPIVLLTPLLFSSGWAVIIIPAFTAAMFDHYFERFFIWRYRKEQLINVRQEFATKISKQKNKVRRIALFSALKDKMQIKDEITSEKSKFQPPHKFIKFGDFTQYIFHSNVGGEQQSSILQTTIFDNFLNIKSFLLGFSQLSMLKEIFTQFKNDFFEFKADHNKLKYSIDPLQLVDNGLIKQSEIYSLEDNIDHNVRRFSELWANLRTGSLQPSTFKLWEHTNMSKYEDIFDQSRYNIKSNTPDLLTYYSIVLLPKLFTFLFKRR